MYNCNNGLKLSLTFVIITIITEKLEQISQTSKLRFCFGNNLREKRM